MQLTCQSVHQETADVTSFLFLPDVSVDFIPGQFITLLVPVDNEINARAYSLSSIPGDELLRLTIKRVANGRVSNYLLNALKPGDHLEAQAPAGAFHSRIAGAGPWLLLSAGCGITPVFSMLRERLAREPEADIVFVHSARSDVDRIFPEELEALAAAHPNLKLHWVIGDDISTQLLEGRLDEAQLKARVPDLKARTAMVCGPQGYMDSVRIMLRKLGVDDDVIHSESFVGLSSQNAPAEAAGCTLWVGEKALPVLPGQTVLDTLEAGEVPILAACRSGVCGSCKCKGEKAKLESSSTSGLTPEEIEQGYFLACSSRVLGDMAVTL